jgi:hypothetical protein
MLKSVLPFASNHSQNYFVKVFQASFADWYLFIEDRIFKMYRNGWVQMYRDLWSSLHIIMAMGSLA